MMASLPRGMQAEDVAAAVGAHLQHLARRHGDRGPARVVVGVAVGHERAERVVAAAQVHHDQIARSAALRERQVAQELRGGEAEREGGDAALDELSAREAHGSTLS
jgi:hypothetical protein